MNVRTVSFLVASVGLGAVLRNLATCLTTVVGGIPAAVTFSDFFASLKHVGYIEGVPLQTIALALCGVALTACIGLGWSRTVWVGSCVVFLLVSSIAYFFPRPMAFGLFNYGIAGFWLRSLFMLLLLGTQLLSGLIVGLLWRRFGATKNGDESKPRSYGGGRRPYDLGFTLVELLAVIAIVAVLAAILLPVLARSRRKGYVADDMAKLHQAYLAVNLYENDHERASPDSLLDLVPAYVPPAVLASRLDSRPPSRQGGWPANVWTGLRPDEEEARLSSPYRISFGYLKPFHHRFTRGQTWEEYRSDPRVGMLVDPVVGECVGECLFTPNEPDQPPYNVDAFLVARMDGSVARRVSPPCRGPSGFTYEQMFLFETLECRSAATSPQ